MKLTIKKLRKLIAEAIYNPDTFPKTGKPIPTSIISGDRESAQKISDYSKAEDGFEPAVNLATMTGKEPAVIGLHGGYEKLREKADKRLPIELKEVVDIAKQLNMTVNFKPPSNPTEEGQIRINITKVYPNNANLRMNRQLSISILYQNLPPIKGVQYLEQGKGIIHSGGEIFYIDQSFTTEDYLHDHPTNESLASLIHAADIFYENAPQLETIYQFHQYSDSLKQEIEDYINLNRESVEFNRKSPREIGELVFLNSNIIKKFYETRVKILKSISPIVYDYCSMNLDYYDYYIEDILDHLENYTEDVMFEKGLGETIAEAYVGFPDKPPVKASKFLDDYELPEKYDEKMRTNLKSLMGSEDRDFQNTGLSAAVGADLDNEVLRAIDAAGGYSFADKDDGPLSKEKAEEQALFNYLENQRPFVGKTIPGYIIYGSTTLPDGSDEINDIVLNGDALDQIYGLLEEGKDAEAKEVAANYLDTEFLNDNYEALKVMFPHVAPHMTKLGITNFSDLCLNHRKNVHIQVSGLMPSDFDNKYNTGSSAGAYIGLSLGNTYYHDMSSHPNPKKEIFKLARRLGLISQSNYSHPAIGFFETPYNTFNSIQDRSTMSIE